MRIFESVIPACAGIQLVVGLRELDYQCVQITQDKGA